MDCAIPEFCQDPSDKLDYHVDFEEHLERIWEADTDYSIGVRIRPPTATGYEYEATTAGRSGMRPPRWPTSITSTVTDGSVTWTARAISTSSLKSTVSGTPAWSADTGLTVSGETVDGQRASAYIAGGDDGQRYLVRVEATMADTTERNASFWLLIKRREIGA